MTRMRRTWLRQASTCLGVAAAAIVASAMLAAAELRSGDAKPSLPPGTIGWVDVPVAEAIVGSKVHVSGWALDPDGIRTVEVRVDGRAYPAHYGIAREDVGRVKPGYPDGRAGGFEFDANLPSLGPLRHEIAIVAVNRAGKETTLARKSLIPAEAFSLWADLPGPPADATSRPFRFLMATSGVAMNGAAEVDTAYAPYLSRTLQIGIAVPILYLRTTKGADADWVFDPDFDLKRKCRDRAVADDSLNAVMRYAIEKKLPVHFVLNGGIWSNATCDAPQWDVVDHLEQDDANCQWNQDDVVFPSDYLKNLPGSTQSPRLARSLTYNVYASKVRAYKRRNLIAAARIVAAFARAHPDLFVGVNLDADTYMNPFFMNKQWFDYNPGMIRQFRHWLAGSGPYAGKAEPGVPDLRAYRRARPMTLADVNRIARKQWRSWESVDPPRRFPGSRREPLTAGELPFWKDPWYQEWEMFRKHIVGLHYDELSRWAHEAGIPTARIFSAQGFIAPEPHLAPFAVRIASRGQDYDTAGVSIEGAIPKFGHLGAILYGETAENATKMEGPHSLFATFARMDPGWAIVETNATNLRTPQTPPVYAQSYRAFRDAFNFDGRQITVMAWNGSNGALVGQPGYSPFTAWRNTPAEEAMRDFLVTHANLPAGARLWTFGNRAHADDDGWRLEGGTLRAPGGFLDLALDLESATLIAPGDQVVRPNDINLLVLGLADTSALASARVFARVDSRDAWRAITPSLPASALERRRAGLLIPLRWPAQWKAGSSIVEEVKIALTFKQGTSHARIDRLALCPANNAPPAGVRRR